jgi:acyl-CoA synthetase (NDP forming)
MPENIKMDSARGWIKGNNGIIGEESLELLQYFGIKTSDYITAETAGQAADAAEKTGYPLVMKVVSPDAIHKSEAKGVILNINSADEAAAAFCRIKDNLFSFNKNARFTGVRLSKQAAEGYDMFIGGSHDRSFGPAVYFGYGGIYVEVFKDVKCLLCPASHDEAMDKLVSLKSYNLIKGTRGNVTGDIKGFIDCIIRVSQLMYHFPEIKELDLNPVRILADGSGVVALDSRLRIG